MNKKILLVLFSVFCFCAYKVYKTMPKVGLIITEKYFQTQSEYELARAVRYQNIKKIKQFCLNHPECVKRTYCEQYYSVLHWAAEIGKMKSVKALLDAGMNPNVTTKDDETPLHTLPYNFTVTSRTKSYMDYSEIIKLLIQYGSDCNYPRKKSIGNEFNMYGITPFMMHVIYGHLEYADIMLRNADVDVNAKMQDDVTAAVYTLREASEYKSSIYNAHYIICKCKADITNPFVMKKKLENFEVKWVKTYPVQLLRELLYPLDSEEYKLKLEIIEEFKNQGIDYYSEPIPDDVLDKIKRLYPKTWEEYIKVY